MTIREHIKSIQDEVVKGDLLPGRASELLNTLSALIGNILDEIRVRQVEYNKVLLSCLENESHANKAKIVASVSPEYDHLKVAQNSYYVSMEIIRSLKYYIRQKEEEYRLGKSI